MLTALTIAAIVAQFAAGARLLAVSRRHYSAFFALFALLSIAAAGAVFLNPGTISYLWFWIALQPLKLALMALAAIELIRRVPEHYGPKPGRLGRDILFRSLQFAILIALASAVLEARYAHNSYAAPWLPFTVTFERVFRPLVALLLILTARWVYASRVRLSRNLPLVTLRCSQRTSPSIRRPTWLEISCRTTFPSA